MRTPSPPTLPDTRGHLERMAVLTDATPLGHLEFIALTAYLNGETDDPTEAIAVLNGLAARQVAA